MTYTQAAVERAVKVHEVLMQALNRRQPWIHVAEVLGVSARTVRRLRWRYETYGFTGLYDPNSASYEALREFCSSDIRTGQLLTERLDLRNWPSLWSDDHSARDGSPCSRVPGPARR